MLTLHNHSNSHRAAALLLFIFSSILNKLTPEKFDKLCLELLNVGVDSKLVLKGIILLVNPCFCFNSSVVKMFTHSWLLKHNMFP